MEFAREIKTIRVDYENKIETMKVNINKKRRWMRSIEKNNWISFKLQSSNEKARGDILQRHESEHKKEIERLQEKATKFEDEATQTHYVLETISRELKEKVFVFNYDERENRIDLYFRIDWSKNSNQSEKIETRKRKVNFCFFDYF